jgi:hypothetical protein
MLKALGSIPGNAKKNYTYFKSATVNVAWLLSGRSRIWTMAFQP